MKKVILVISEQFQADACGFVDEFEKLGGRIESVVCLLPKKTPVYYAKRNLRFLKKLSPSALKRSMVFFIAKAFNKRTIADARQSLASSMPGSRELISKKFDLFQYAKEKKIPLYFSPGFTPALVKQLTKDGPVIFPMYAGGIWSKEVLDIPNAELVNAHMGEMPRYRGMNVIEWATWEGQQPRVAVMIMNDKIDGGDVILHTDIPVKHLHSVHELRKAGFTACYSAMAEGIYKYQKGEVSRTKQNKGAKYYYRMHPDVKTMLEKKLAN
jgi:folate-dependent phosphoribosylglycinamide formyltransferase PurN